MFLIIVVADLNCKISSTCSDAYVLNEVRLPHSQGLLPCFFASTIISHDAWVDCYYWFASQENLNYQFKKIAQLL